MMPLISAPNLNNRFAHLVFAAVILTALGWLYFESFGPERTLHLGGLREKEQVPLAPQGAHPIDELVRRADEELQSLLRKEAGDVHSAAQAYRERRGRQPPPGFDAWFNFAKENDALVVEDFFDQIYHDLAPFWGVPALQIRQQANDFLHRISIRSGNVTSRTDIERREWMELWKELVQTVGQHLPDMDLPINVMDESRMVVPWEEIDGYMEKERASREIVPAGKLKQNFTGLASLDVNPPPAFDPGFMPFGPYWPLAVVGCPPGSPARSAYIETTFDSPPPLPSGFPDHSYEGYVSNWTVTKSPCDNPNLQGLHGTFVEPISISTTKRLFPLFGGSKLPMNNEILLPPAMYWTQDPFYSGGKEHGAEWSKKKQGLIWRGAASGGRNKKENWTRFQRHRFVSMVNSTSVKLAEASSTAAKNFALPAPSTYPLSAARAAGSLGDWVSSWSDVSFVHLLCFPDPSPPHCQYTDPYYTVEHAMPMKEQYAYKYLPDLDGNSFSGRYRGFLGSTSLPIKATIYNEWHDSRLVPWKHFVPMDNTFADIYGIMEYFVGNRAAGVAGHDDVASRIAGEGKAWTEKVLRTEDMQIYVFRLLLEYARICDDERDRLGWAEDGIT